MTISPESIKSYTLVALDTWLTCGKCATSFGLTTLAIKSYEQALFYDQTNKIALAGLSNSLRLNDININETIGSQRSIDLINQAISLNSSLSQSSLIFKELSECYLLIGLNEQAHQSIQRALALSPKDPSLWLLSAQTYIRGSARSHAQQALNQCLELLPKDLKQPNDSFIDYIETARAAHAESAAIAAADGNIQLSIHELTATLSLPPPPLSRIDEHVALWCALSTAKERDNDIHGAINACELARQAVGNSPRILMTHAYLLLLLVSKDNSLDSNTLLCKQAVEILSNFIDLDLDKNTVNDGDFLPWYLLGKAYSLSDQPRLAYDSYQIALRNASNSPITWLAVGKLYLELKQLPDALEAYSHALKLQMEEDSPGTATAWDGLSCVYERCDDQLSDASDACNRSAACYRTLGDTQQAEIYERRAELLLKASENQGPVPPLREPPDVPPYLLRDLVALLPSERIAFIQGLKDVQPSHQNSNQVYQKNDQQNQQKLHEQQHPQTPQEQHQLKQEQHEHQQHGQQQQEYQRQQKQQYHHQQQQDHQRQQQQDQHHQQQQHQEHQRQQQYQQQQEHERQQQQHHIVHQDQQAHAQAQAHYRSPSTQHIQQPQHTPQPPQMTPHHGPYPPRMYPVPPSFKDKSSSQGQPLAGPPPPPPQWQQGPPQPPGAQPTANGGPQSHNDAPPFYYQSGPSVPNGPGGPPFRSPMNQPMAPNGHFNGPAPPPPPGYYGYPMHPYPQPMYR